jgi:hypothetical protein
MAWNNINWNELFFNINTDMAVENFSDVVNSILDKYVPVFKVLKTKFHRWLNGNLCRLIKEKQLFNTNYKKNPNTSTYLRTLR